MSTNGNFIDPDSSANGNFNNARRADNVFTNSKKTSVSVNRELPNHLKSG